MMHRSPILATGLGVSERGCDTASNYVLYVCTCTGTGIFELALRYIFNISRVVTNGQKGLKKPY
jgi:hypothetical protein